MAEPNPSLERHTGGHPGDVFFRRPRLHHRGLHHVLGVSALFSSAYGNVGSSIYYALGVTALYALGLTPAVFIFSGLIFACTALTYAEGATAIPEAGGSSTFARRAFNDLAGFLAGWSLMLGYIVTIGISAFAVPNYLSFFLPVLKVWPLNSIVGIGVVAALAAVNVAGVKESAWLNITLALLDLLTQAAIVAVGFFTLFSLNTLISNVHWGVAPTWGNLLLGISVSMIAYTGIETVSNLAEETRSPGRNIPRSIILVVITVLGMFGLISTLALSAMPVYQDPSGVWTTELAEKWIEDPVLGLVSKMPEGVRAISGTWVALLAATILIIATNAGILGLSRLSYSMARHKLLPAAIGRIDEQRQTPTAAIIIFSAIASLIILPGNVSSLADLYSFGAILAFAIAHLSIIALRVREPDMARPFKIPMNIRIKGKQIPITAIIGLAGTLGTWIVVLVTHPFGRYAGSVWMLGGLALYFVYRARTGMGFLKPTPEQELMAEE